MTVWPYLLRYQLHTIRYATHPCHPCQNGWKPVLASSSWNPVIFCVNFIGHVDNKTEDNKISKPSDYILAKLEYTSYAHHRSYSAEVIVSDSAIQMENTIVMKHMLVWKQRISSGVNVNSWSAVTTCKSSFLFDIEGDRTRQLRLHPYHKQRRSPFVSVVKPQNANIIQNAKDTINDFD